MKFPPYVVNWLKTLYTGIQSQCLVNGYFSSKFDILRGVRQGCPLSMMVFVIFQNPLYIAIELSNNIKPVEIVGSYMKEIGYADDTNIVTCDNESFLEIF